VKRALPRKKPEPLPTERECTSRSCRTKKYRQWRKALTHQQHRRHPGGGGVRSLTVLGKSATAQHRLPQLGGGVAITPTAGGAVDLPGLLNLKDFERKQLWLRFEYTF